MPINKTMSQIRPRARINNHALIPCLRESLFIYLFIYLLRGVVRTCAR